MSMFRRKSLSWAQIRNSPKHGLGTEKISKDAIDEPLPRHLKEDADLLAMRFWTKAPMVGYRDGRIFYVLWLDPNFSLYDHG